jgi:LacI family transcriptional regulator
MAARAVGEVVDIIQGRAAAPGKIAFPTEIIIRNSTGPAPRPA